MRTLAWTRGLLALGIIVASQLGSSAQTFPVLNLTNTIWRFNQSNNLDTVDWTDPEYDDTQPDWQQGRSLLSNDSGNSTIAPMIGTLINGPRVAAAGVVQHSYYFRTHFNWDRPLVPGTELRFNMRIDDGAIFFLNGTEIFRLRVDAATAIMFASSDQATAYACGGDPDCGDDVVSADGAALVQGMNVLSAIVYQEGTDSSDITFGAGLTIIEPFAPVLLDPDRPTNRIVLESRPTTLEVVADGYPPPAYQWYFEPESGGGFNPVPDATNSTYAIANMTAADAGQYYAEVSNSLGTTNSRTAIVNYTEDAISPSVVEVVGSASLTSVVVLFDEAVDPATGGDEFNYFVEDELGNSISVLGANIGSDGKTVILTTDPQAENTVYTLTVTSVSDLVGNVMDDAVINFRSWVTSACAGLLFEVFTGLSTTDNNLDTTLLASPNYPDNPAERYRLSVFSSREVYPDNSHEGYGGRIRGLFIPPTSGNWIFHLASDDPSRLWLNPSGPDAAGKTLIAQETSCCNLWTGGAWVSAPQPLEAGRGYYIEAIYKEGTGGDYIQVAARLESDPAPTDDPETVALSPNAIPGTMLGAPVAPLDVTGPFTISEPPVDVTAREGTTAIFTVGLSPEVPACYQWQRNGEDIPDAFGPTYALVASVEDDGAQFSVLVSTIGGSGPIASPAATLHVTLDNTGPNLVSVASTDAYQTNIVVTFNEPMDTNTTSVAANYQIDGVTVGSATATSPTTSVLVPGAPLASCVTHQVTISAVTDQFGNVIDPNPSTGSFIAPLVLVPIDEVHLWRYEDTGAVLDGIPWMMPGFDDSAWSEGPGVLAFEGDDQMPAGYPIRTRLANYVSARLTYYFRTHFDLATDPATVTNLVWHELVDDASVVYLNGVLVHTNRMPAPPYAYNTGATGGATEPHPVEGPFAFPTSALVAGDNVLAVEVHQSGTSSSDIVWGGELRAEVSECRPPPPQIVGINIIGNSLAMEWTGGGGPFVVQKKTDLSSPGWTDVTVTPNNTIDLELSEPTAFFQVVNQNPAFASTTITNTVACDGMTYTIAVGRPKYVNVRNLGECPITIACLDQNGNEVAGSAQPLQVGGQGIDEYDAGVFPTAVRVTMKCDGVEGKDCILVRTKSN